MSLWRRALVVIAQTVAGLVGGVGCALIGLAVSEWLTPPPAEVLCEFICAGEAFLPALIGIPLCVTGGVWLVGRAAGQRGNFWLTLMGVVIGFGIIFIAQLFGVWLPPILDIVIPVLIGPFMAALVYQLSTRNKTTQEVIEVTHE